MDKLNAKDSDAEGIKSLILIDESNEDRDLKLNQESKDRLLVAKIGKSDYETLAALIDGQS